MYIMEVIRHQHLEIFSLSLNFSLQPLISFFCVASFRHVCLFVRPCKGLMVDIIRKFVLLFQVMVNI